MSNNLGIPFADLKTATTGIDMTGATSADPVVSLGQAIQQLKPGVDATAEAQKAQRLAAKEIISPAPTASSGSTPR